MEKIKPGWAVLIYSSASPDIEQAARKSLAEIAPQDSVVVGSQLGLRENGRAVALRSDGTRLEGVDMSRPASLTEFLRWGLERYPAERVMVVLGGHGGGFLGAVSDVGRRRFLMPGEMRSALDEAGIKPDVLVFNSCLMAQAEIAHELYPRAHYLVAAQSAEEGVGIPLGEVVKALPGRDAEQGALAVVEACQRTPERTPTMAALDLTCVEPLADALDELARRFGSNLAKVREHVLATPHFWKHEWDRPLSEMRDLSLFLRRLEGDPSLTADLRERASAALEALENLVVGSTGSEGLSVYLPGAASTEPVEQRYQALRFARETYWDEAIKELAREGPKGG
ncbi:hypothetical protein DYH09_12710 [bacterium CPR1]|nr:hypothetical protein [bacterium CPR1]